jgi:hypothetical protein
LKYTQEFLIGYAYEKSACEIRVNAPNAYFVNLADIHQGLNHRKYFQQWLSFLFSIPNLHIGLGGDAGNGITRSSKGNPLEEWASGSKQLYALAEDLKPWVEADRLRYIIKGNHLAGRMEDETFHCPEELLAWILGKPELYKGSQAIMYFNVNSNCYVSFAQHKASKKKDTFAWVNADITWREHTHDAPGFEERLIMDHNKFAKRPVIKKIYEINSGHWLIAPTYAMDKGYRPTPPGCIIAELGGGDDRSIKLWTNEQLYQMVQRGYRL